LDWSADDDTVGNASGGGGPVACDASGVEDRASLDPMDRVRDRDASVDALGASAGAVVEGCARAGGKAVDRDDDAETIGTGWTRDTLAGSGCANDGCGGSSEVSGNSGSGGSGFGASIRTGSCTTVVSAALGFSTTGFLTGFFGAGLTVGFC
jgi:hypothetical protein